jgi:ABC-type transport system involved in cytochrome bd biosynthesis fused ATPase/permease subunit
MKIHELKAEITVLETQLAQYEKLFEDSIENNVEFAQTRIIYHELRKITEKIKEIRNLTE